MSCGKLRQSGGRVVMPSEYYGLNSGRYYADGSTMLTPREGSFSPIVARSFGTLIDNNTFMAPNLPPFPNALPASPSPKPDTQIGGRRRRRSRKRRSYRRRSRY